MDPGGHVPPVPSAICAPARKVKQMANRYIEGKADEYSSKQAWSLIGEQYPEGLTREVIQVHKQWSRQEQTESKWKAKG